MKSFLFSLTLLLSLTTVPLLAEASLDQGSDNQGTIVDIAVATPELSTLVTALQVAGLDDDLATPGPFTVFAPTNQAFANLPDGVLDELLANPDALADVLLYHVASGKKYAKKLAGLRKLKTLLGQKVKITVVGGSLYINNAKVILADVMASNGVVHVIDAVLIPASE